MSERDSAWVRATPGVFVVLWATGFIGAKFGLPFAEPFTFLFIRLLLTVGLLTMLALATRAPWPRSLGQAGHIAVSGLLVHAAYLGGVFAAIRGGLPAGIVSLVVGVQPLLTALMARQLLGERVTARQWSGLVLGFCGVALVLGGRLPEGGSLLGNASWAAVGWALTALLGITAGTLYQKRFCTSMNLVSGAIVQYSAAAAALGLGAFLLETMRVQWTLQFVLALGYLVVALSVLAVSLLMFLIRRGEVSRVASMFYLVPPTTAILAWLLFDERLAPTALVGMAMVAAGVALVVAPRR